MADIIPLRTDGADQLIQAIVDGNEDLLTEDELALVDQALPEDRESDHYENLAENLPKKMQDLLASWVCEAFEEDEDSRKEWQYRERDGIRILGVSENTIPGAEFSGASEVIYPGLMEAISQFSARALAEIWPSDGVAKTVVVGDVTPDSYAQADRVKNYLNYLYDEEIPGAFEETDRLMFRLPLAGSMFVKIYYDDLMGSIVKSVVPSNDFVAPYEATDFNSIPRYTHIMRINRHDFLRLQKSGFYLDTEIKKPVDETAQTNQTLIDEVDDVNSVDRTNYFSHGHRHVVLEHFMYLGDIGERPEFDEFMEDGLPMPYFVSVEKEDQRLLSIRRAWRPDDPKKRPRHPWVHYRFLPGFSFYGIGYYHILGHLARAETGALRALLDSAQFSNMQGGFRSRDVRIENEERPISPGEYRATEATAEELSKGFFNLPFKEPSDTLYKLLQWLDDVTRRVAGTTEVAVGDAPNNAPVGTTLALIEQTQKVQTGIHIRLHKAMRQELKLVSELCYLYLPKEYPYAVAGGQNFIKQSDFDGRVDVIPLSDPNVTSAAQRIARAQAEKELAAEAPDLFDRRKVYMRMLSAIGTVHPEELIPDNSQVPHKGPIEENMAIITNDAVKAYPDQDHQAHILVHKQWFNSLDEESRGRVEGTYFAHIGEHMALEYQAQMMNAMGIQIPPGQELDPMQENMLATMAAQAAQIMIQEKPAPVDPLELKAQRDADRQDMSALAQIERKELETAAKIERDDALAIAKMQREVAETEEKIIRNTLSDEAKEAAESLPK